MSKQRPSNNNLHDYNKTKMTGVGSHSALELQPNSMTLDQSVYYRDNHKQL